MELREATGAEKVERDALTHAEWGGLLSLEQYLHRERFLRGLLFSKGMTTWFWCEGAQVLSSCETYANDSRIGSEAGQSFSFASVFTELKLRGKGHATKMMDAVVERLATRSKAQACVLYSDVGAKIYERSGFVAVPAQDWILTPLHGDPEKDVVPLQHAFKVAVPLSDGLVLCPSPQQLEWAYSREEFYARELKRQRPSFHAANDEDALAVWTANYKESELVVQWLGGKDTRNVLRAAQRQAWRCGLERVRTWAQPHLSVPEGAAVTARDGELPMYRAFGRVTGWKHVQRALWV